MLQGVAQSSANVTAPLKNKMPVNPTTNNMPANGEQSTSHNKLLFGSFLFSA
jgi:hypothetical protein